jgi:hypothetical protein
MDKAKMEQPWLQMKHRMETEGVDGVIAHPAGMDQQEQNRDAGALCPGQSRNAEATPVKDKARSPLEDGRA